MPPEKKQYTAKEFLEITPESSSDRYELYDGEIVAKAAPSTLHQRFGVREYWIVDTENQRTVVHYFDEGFSPDIYTFDSFVPVGIYNGQLTINISELLK